MFYRIAHVVVWILAKILFRLKVIDEIHVPREGGVVVAANHNSYFDIPLLGCALSRRADNMAKSELFRNRFIAFFFRLLGGFPVRRGTIDRRAIDEAVQRLRKGHLLAIYPEGTRSKDGRLQSPKPGIGMIIARSEAKVVPVYIRGTSGIRLFQPVTIIFGKPLDFKGETDESRQPEKEGIHSKALYARISQEIMTQIAVLERQVMERDR
ncbi:MAG: lysophospholipid acyltransferase family protein [Candidatus Manganitrophaceae bacterium]